MSTLHLPVTARASHDGASASRPLGAVWTRLGRLWTQRQLPHPRTATEEAKDVRRMAVELQRTDPRFAADLFAAADRHERLHG